MPGDDSWGNRLSALFDDLEQQAEGLHLAERDAEVGDRSRSEYSRVSMASRLHASVGGMPALRVLGVGRLEGVLMRVGLDWCLVRTGPSAQEWIVRLGAIVDVRGLSDRAVSAPARTVLARLSLGSALRGVAEAGGSLVFEQVDGTRHQGSVLRVGEDFVEIRSSVDPPVRGGDPVRYVLAFGTLAAVRRM